LAQLLPEPSPTQWIEPTAKNLSGRKISLSNGLNKKPRRTAQEPDPRTLSFRTICINILGRDYLKHFQLLMLEHGIDLNYEKVRAIIRSNHLPAPLSTIFQHHAAAYARKQLPNDLREMIELANYWISCRERCIEFGGRAYQTSLAGQNEKVTVGPWNGTFRPPAQKRLNPREALARGAAPTADRQAAGHAVQEPIPAPEPIADLLNAWFPPRPKNPSVK